MRAVRIEGPGRVAVVDVPEPVPAPGELLVRVRRAALCATDRRLARLGADGARIPGHEVAGVLEDGTGVGVHPNLGCGRCPHCVAGLENRCRRHQDLGIHRDGGLAEWLAVPSHHVVPAEGLAPEDTALVEPVAACLHATRLLEVREGDAALVVGAGSLGLLAMWVLQALGARVGVAQRSPERREIARELGAQAALGLEDDAARALGDTPRVAFVAAPGAEALAWALERVAEGGRVHAFSGTPGGAPVDANVVHYRHLALVGSTGSTVEDYREALALVHSGRVPVGTLPRRTVGLSEVPGVLLDPAPDPRVLKLVARISDASGTMP